MKIFAPWNFRQVQALNAWQRRGDVHPFTCGGDNNGQRCGAVLRATVTGWVCSDGCGYTQNWAHGFMLKGVDA